MTMTWIRIRVGPGSGFIFYQCGSMILIRIKINLTLITAEKHWNRKTILQQYRRVFDVVIKQIVKLLTYQITCLVKWVCLHCKIAASHENFFLKVVLLF